MAMQDTLDQIKNFDPSELDPSNVGSWPAAVKAILMLLLLLLVLGLGYQLYLTDKRDDIERAELKQQELREDYEGKYFKAANLDAFRQQKQEMEETFGELVEQLPKDTEVPGLIEDITRAALDNALTIESINLKDCLLYTSPSPRDKRQSRMPSSA